MDVCDLGVEWMVVSVWLAVPHPYMKRAAHLHFMTVVGLLLGLYVQSHV